MRRFLCGILLFSVVFWNLENFFDWHDGSSSSSDSEFSSRGARHWTRKRFDAKAAMVGKTLLWADAPAIVGLAEIENERVVKELLGSDVLRKSGYRYIHYDSPDPRGIDVALLYRPDVFEKIHSYPIAIPSLRTRDILYVCMAEKGSGELWHFFVNHHPSKYGGNESADRRIVAMRALKNSVDSLLAAGQGNIVAMGDFNDVPSSEAFSIMEGCLVNMGSAIDGGSIRFKGRWQLIDNYLVSADVAEKMRMEVLRPPFLMERDRQYPGDKPKRTYIGPRYNGGVSDHLPVGLRNTSSRSCPER